MIDRLFSAFEGESLDMATLCSPVSDKIEFESPHTVKVVLDRQGFALYFSRSPIPYFQRSSGIPVYKHIGIYAFSRPFLETFVSLPKGRLEETESLEQLRALEAGHRIKVLVVSTTVSASILLKISIKRESCWLNNSDGQARTKLHSATLGHSP